MKRKLAFYWLIVFVTMTTPKFAHVKDKNYMFTARGEDMIFLVKGKILVFHQYLYNKIQYQMCGISVPFLARLPSVYSRTVTHPGTRSRLFEPRIRKRPNAEIAWHRDRNLRPGLTEHRSHVPLRRRSLQSSFLSSPRVTIMEPDRRLSRSIPEGHPVGLTQMHKLHLFYWDFLMGNQIIFLS